VDFMFSVDVRRGGSTYKQQLTARR